MNNTERERFEKMVNTGVEDMMYEQSDELEPPSSPSEEYYQTIRNHIAKTKLEVSKVDLPMAQSGGKTGGSHYEYINSPQHYQWFDIEAIDAIKKILTHEQYKGFLMGTSLRYRFRCGSKKGEPLERDIKKAKQYEQFWYDYVAENQPHA